MAERDGAERSAAARVPSMRRIARGIPWLRVGVAATVGAVAAPAICLALLYDPLVSAPKLRLSIAPSASQPFDFAQIWHEEWTQVTTRSSVVLSVPHDRDRAWMPDGGLSVLWAKGFRQSTATASLSARDAVVASLPLPLPMPRPDGIDRPAVARPSPTVIEPQVAALPPQPEPQPKAPGLFDRLFGDPDRTAKAVIAANPKTALYDITKRVLYLPDGDKLEAHSGYGQWMDDPGSVHRRDYGATPPNVYALSFREQPFHGVRALRMKPVGTGNMYGRDGILAHSYLLGEQGASNGCVSVKDYDKFLQAYEAGKFDRIIVVRSVDEPQPAQVAGGPAQGT